MAAANAAAKAKAAAEAARAVGAATDGEAKSMALAALKVAKAEVGRSTCAVTTLTYLFSTHFFHKTRQQHVRRCVLPWRTDWLIDLSDLNTFTVLSTLTDWTDWTD